jgi:hypothetical protein
LLSSTSSVFDTAFLAAVRELAHQGMPRASQIMAQIATNEAEHRVPAREVASGAGFTTLSDINPGASGTVPTSPGEEATPESGLIVFTLGPA